MPDEKTAAPQPTAPSTPSISATPTSAPSVAPIAAPSVADKADTLQQAKDAASGTQKSTNATNEAQQKKGSQSLQDKFDEIERQRKATLAAAKGGPAAEMFLAIYAAQQAAINYNKAQQAEFNKIKNNDSKSEDNPQANKSKDKTPTIPQKLTELLEVAAGNKKEMEAKWEQYREKHEEVGEKTFDQCVLEAIKEFKADNPNAKIKEIDNLEARCEAHQADLDNQAKMEEAEQQQFEEEYAASEDATPLKQFT